MEKYKRFTIELNTDDEIQNFLDEITTDGWKIIHYNETIKDVNILFITIIGSKSQSDIL